MFRLEGFNGIREKTKNDSSLFPDNELQIADNVEITTLGELSKRYGTDTFDTINTDLSTIIADVKRFWVWYPLNTITISESIVQNKDYMILLWVSTDGNTGDIYLAANVTAGVDPYWLLLNEEAALFEDQYPPTVAVYDKGIVISTGRNGSPIKFVNINSDHELVYGDIGIEAPKSIPNTSAVYSDHSFADEGAVDTGMDIPKGSVIQTCYTIVLNDGTESNPSPIETYTLMQYQSKGAIDESDVFTYDTILDKFWKSRKVEDIDINFDTYTGNIANAIKYINVYRRDCPYTQGNTGFGEFYLIKQFPVFQDKEQYNIVDVYPYETETLSYENDTACKGEDVATIGNQVFIANANSRITFPYLFKYYSTIRIDNSNSRNYVDAIIRIQLKDSSLEGGIERLNLEDYFDPATGVFYVSDDFDKCLRIYDIDLTTPCKVLYKDYDSTDKTIDLYVKVPYIQGNSSHVIYLVWTDASEIDDIGTVSDFDYGQWKRLDAATWSGYLLFKPARVFSEDMVICSSMEYLSGAFTFLINRATDLVEGRQWATSAYSSDVHFFSQVDDQFIFDETLRTLDDLQVCNGTTALLGEGAFAYEGITALGNNKFWGFICFIAEDLASGSPDNEFSIFSNLNSSDHTGVMFGWDAVDYFFVRYYVGTTLTTDYSTIGGLFADPLIANILFAYDGVNKKAFIYHKSLLDGTYVEDSEEITLSGDPELLGDEDFMFLGNKAPAMDYFDNIVALGMHTLVLNDYINDEDIAKNIMNMMPYYPTSFMGYKYSTGTYENITFGATKQILFNDPDGILRWGSDSFPDLNFIKLSDRIVKLIPIKFPSELVMHNTLLVMCRNSLKRFVLSGNPNEWSGGVTDNMIEEQAHLSVTDSTSVVQVGSTIFYKSEAGIMVMDTKSTDPVEISKYVIDLGNIIEDAHFAVYIPVKNQVWFYNADQTGDKSPIIVYDLSLHKFIGRYSGINFIWADILDGGFGEENKTIFLVEDESGDSSFVEYPSDTLTTETVTITTKKFSFDSKTRVRRAKAYFTGSSTKVNFNMYNVYFDGGVKILSYSTLTSGKWFALPVGFAGEQLEITVSDFETFEKIELELIQRGE